MTETRLWTGRLRSVRMVAGLCAIVHHTEIRPMAQQMRVRGIDIAPLVFYVVGMDDPGTVALRTRTTGRAGAATRARAFRLPGDLECQCSMGHAALKAPVERHPGPWSGRGIQRGGHRREVPCASAW